MADSPSFTPLLLGFGLIIVLGFFIPLLTIDTTDISTISPNSTLINFTIDKINASLSIPFFPNATLTSSDVYGEEFVTYMVNYLKAISLIPSWILIPLSLIIILLISYGLITWLAYLWDAFFL